MLKPILLGAGLLAAGLLGADYTAPGPLQDDPPAQRGAGGRRLLPQRDTLLLMRIGWACPCPDWSTVQDWHKYGKNESKLARHCLFIEPATPAQELPDYFSMNQSRFNVRVVGQFYARPGYPEGVLPYEGGHMARVFRYTCYELEERNPFLPKDDTTLVVSYEARTCPCAPWATRPKEANPSEQARIYLEPATPLLPVADNLWTGQKLPLRLLVTGQFVDELGYPKGYVEESEEPEGEMRAAPVFRYRSLKVLPNQRKATGRKQ